MITDKTSLKAVESKLRAYFESLATREAICYRIEVLLKQRADIEESLSQYPMSLSKQSYDKQCEALFEVNAQILMYKNNLRFLDNEFAQLEYAINALPERERLIILAYYKRKKTHIAIGCDMYLTGPRVHQIRTKVLGMLQKYA